MRATVFSALSTLHFPLQLNKEVHLLFLLSNKDSVSYDNDNDDDDDDEGLSWIQLYFESMLTIKETKPFKHQQKAQPLCQKL